MRQLFVLITLLVLMCVGCAKQTDTAALDSKEQAPSETTVASNPPATDTASKETKNTQQQEAEKSGAEKSQPKKTSAAQDSAPIDDRYGAGKLGPRVLQHAQEIVDVEPIRLTYYEEILDTATGPELTPPKPSPELEELFRLQRKRLSHGKYRGRLRGRAHLRTPRPVRVFSDPSLVLRPGKMLTISPSMMLPETYNTLAHSIPPTMPLRANGAKNWAAKLRLLVPKSSPVPFAEWQRIIADAGRCHKLDPLFIAAIIKAESNFDPMSVSPVGAQGAMQIMPGTQEELGLKDPFDVRANVFAGAAYIRWLLKLYPATELALAAYNAGPNAVQKAKGIPPYAETQQYVNRVLKYWLDRRPAPIKVAQAESEQKRDEPERKVQKAKKSKKERGKREKG